MNYQPISDPAQLQILEDLARMFQHGVLLTIAVATVVLLCLCVAELQLSWPRPSESEGSEWRRDREALLPTRRATSLDRLTPVRLWDTAADRSSACPPAESAPPLRQDRSERGHGWGEPVEAR